MEETCQDCNSKEIQRLVWVDQNDQYAGESHYSENGEYWCCECQEHKNRKE